jgi:hypothetical protein
MLKPVHCPFREMRLIAFLNLIKRFTNRRQKGPISEFRQSIWHRLIWTSDSASNASGLPCRQGVLLEG